MLNTLKPGDVIDGRFRLVELLFRGYISTVYKALDLCSGSRCIVKVFFKDVPRSLDTYTKHLLRVQRTLAGVSIPGVLLPIQVGETRTFAYQAFEFLERRRSLDDFLRRHAPLRPSKALTILAKVAKALHGLHSHKIIHADVKPANILISDAPQNEVFLIDFGMVQYIDADDLILVGTYVYMHPHLKGDFYQGRDDLESLTVAGRQMDIYVDIYSLGVVAVEMLTGRTEVPSLPSVPTLTSLLVQKNSILSGVDSALLKQVVSLLLQTLTIRPSDRGLSAHAIYTTSCNLATRFEQWETAREKDKELIEPVPSGGTPPLKGGRGDGVVEALQRLESAVESLAKASEVMLRTAHKLTPIPRDVPFPSNSLSPPSLLEETNKAFSRASARIRTSWKIGVGMTVVCFGLIVGLVLCAVTLTFVTRKAGWGLLFGGASVPMIIGTLLWRPYDRVFRATILAQQLEMIHLQFTAAMQSTSGLRPRLEICREAIDRLQALLAQYGMPT